MIVSDWIRRYGVKRLEAISVQPVHFLPVFRAFGAPVVGVFFSSDIKTKRVRGIAILVKLNISKRYFTAHQQLFTVSFEVVLVISTGSNSSPTRLHTIGYTFLYGD